MEGLLSLYEMDWILFLGGHVCFRVVQCVCGAPLSLLAGF